MAEQTLTFPIRSNKLTQSVLVSEHVAHVETPFQKIDIYDSEAFGKLLLLDGHIQLSELDEHVYHEALVQIPLLSLENPRSALVIGGGDGGVVRELAKHPNLERIDMVEIDQGVVDTCLRHMPELCDGAFDNPRVNLHIGDAFDFVQASTDRYDLIVVDSTDVYEEEDGALSERLFTQGFFRDCRDRLTEQGVVVTQADNLVFCPYSLEAIQDMFQGVFAKTGSYFAIIPSFGGFSGFAWGSNGTELKRQFRELSVPNVPLRYVSQEAYDFGFAKLPF